MSGSLGSAIARRLLKEGYEVVGTRRSNPVPEDFVAGGGAVIDLDMDDRKSMDALTDTVLKWGKLDFYVNTASNTPALGRFESIPIETFERDLRVNVLNQVYLLKRLLPLFNPGSNIIFILSEVVKNGRLSYVSSYTMSKYALLGLMSSLSVELKPRGIRVNGVSPGLMETNFTASTPRIVKERYANESKSGMLVRPEEVADEILRVINSPGVNGENIPVF